MQDRFYQELNRDFKDEDDSPELNDSLETTIMEDSIIMDDVPLDPKAYSDSKGGTDSITSKSSFLGDDTLL